MTWDTFKMMVDEAIIDAGLRGDEIEIDYFDFSQGWGQYPEVHIGRTKRLDGSLGPWTITASN